MQSPSFAIVDWAPNVLIASLIEFCCCSLPQITDIGVSTGGLTYVCIFATSRISDGGLIPPVTDKSIAVLQVRHRQLHLSELVQYIHLNPVRAKMERTEDYPNSSHRAYMGLEPKGPVDVDSVLRHFGPQKAVARNRFAAHVAAGMSLGHLAHLYETKGGVLGSEDFVDQMIHRVGEFEPKGTPRASNLLEINTDDLVKAVEEVFGLSRIEAREALIVAGRRLGVSARQLSDITGLGIATISRRHEAALRKLKTPGDLERNVGEVLRTLHEPKDQQ